ncbi:hypothetical protein GW17_00053487 [Ensete ventricosum]|nr:hypothetical protein GW17_00053487 [Ensete ventricosum]RZS18861.1 hypothetical protein BHM03_00051198 [Ensete ventricosum]
MRCWRQRRGRNDAGEKTSFSGQRGCDVGTEVLIYLARERWDFRSMARGVGTGGCVGQGARVRGWGWVGVAEEGDCFTRSLDVADEGWSVAVG